MERLRAQVEAQKKSEEEAAARSRTMASNIKRRERPSPMVARKQTLIQEPPSSTKEPFIVQTTLPVMRSQGLFRQMFPTQSGASPSI